MPTRNAAIDPEDSPVLQFSFDGGGSAPACRVLHPVKPNGEYFWIVEPFWKVWVSL